MTSTTSLLLADDSPTIAKILGMALQAEPIEIRAVQTAEAAMTELQLRPPYFFLVDLMLPEINGYEFARLIRSDPKLKDVRIVLLSSAFDPIDEAEFQACGADAVIAKPFDPSELREQLHKLQGIAPKPVDPDALDENIEGDAPSEDPSLLLNLEADAPTVGGDADSILSSLLSPDAPPSAPPASLTPQPGVLDLSALDLGEAHFTPTPTPEPQDPTVILDLSGGEVPFKPEENVLDLSGSWQTPPGGTALLEAANLVPPPEAPTTPPPSFDASAALPPSAPPGAPGGLSPNAEALAAFFAAEIDANVPPAAPAAAPEAPPAAPEQPEEDSFDASLSSIDWGGPAEVSLNSWSAPPPKKTRPDAPPAAIPTDDEPPAAPPARAAQPAPTPAPERPLGPPPSAAPAVPASPAAPAAPTAPPASRPAAAAPASPAPQSPPTARPATMAPNQGPPSAPPAGAPKNGFAGATSDRGSFLFDTGGSNFRFADDYVQRITRAFTGAVDEMVLGKDPAPTPSPSASVFPKESHDSAPATASAPHAGGGAWSPEDIERIERLVRDEVQLVVREMVEKVAWEVIPELAENLIRKQLDQVLKQMEE